MTDPNMHDFQARVRRLRRQHALGQGFSAPDTLSRSDFHRPRVQKRPILRTALFMLAFLFGIKGAVHHHLGPDGYAARVDRLSQAGGVDAVQAALMRPDPVTEMISHVIDRVLS